MLKTPRVQFEKAKKSLQADFFSTAQVKHFSHLSLYWKPSITARATVVVPKKRVALAVDRHRVKRQVREAFRKVVSAHPDFSSQLVVVVKKTVPFMEMVKLLNNFVERVKT